MTPGPIYPMGKPQLGTTQAHLLVLSISYDSLFMCGYLNMMHFSLINVIVF